MTAGTKAISARTISSAIKNGITAIAVFSIEVFALNIHAPFPELKASLISSKELSETELENISKELSLSMGSKIKFDFKIDEELIGGFKLHIGSFMIDTSIKNKLKKFQQRMLEN